MICAYCKKEFKRISVSDTCSLKCRLLHKTKKTDSCWLWTGVIINKYGKLRFKTKFLSAHRVSYEIFKGPITDGLFVCHSCDNPLCVNPDHLWLGTPKENAQDAVKKGRIICHNKGKKSSEETKKKISKNHADMRGEKSPRSKLKESQVYEIRELLNNGHTQKSVAEKFEVSKGAIMNIRYRTRWSHI